MLRAFPEIGLQTFKFLTFRNVKFDVRSQGVALFVFVLLITWFAGIGRYWDHPNAEVWQYWGLGSVAYIFVLSALIYIIMWPLKPERWDWLSIFVFVGLTSPLAWLYAIPVERFTSPDTARALNVNFLAVVAIWRVALYVLFLYRYAVLRGLKLVIGIFGPLVLIIIGLAMLNLEHAVFEIMAGLEQDRTEAEKIYDQRYIVVTLLSIFSFLAAPIWIIMYAVALIDEYYNRKKNR